LLSTFLAALASSNNWTITIGSADSTCEKNSEPAESCSILLSVDTTITYDITERQSLYDIVKNSWSEIANSSTLGSTGISFYVEYLYLNSNRRRNLLQFNPLEIEVLLSTPVDCAQWNMSDWTSFWNMSSWNESYWFNYWNMSSWNLTEWVYQEFNVTGFNASFWNSSEWMFLNEWYMEQVNSTGSWNISTWNQTEWLTFWMTYWNCTWWNFDFNDNLTLYSTTDEADDWSTTGEGSSQTTTTTTTAAAKTTTTATPVLGTYTFDFRVAFYDGTCSNIKSWYDFFSQLGGSFESVYQQYLQSFSKSYGANGLGTVTINSITLSERDASGNTISTTTLSSDAYSLLSTRFMCFYSLLLLIFFF